MPSDLHSFSPTPGTAAAPVADKDRILSVDVLRGVAVLGILLINIPEFSMPDRYSEAFRSDPSNGSFWVRAFLLVFVEGKMRALFSLLFGAGILLFLSGKNVSKIKLTSLFCSRMGWLIMFGLADAHLLLWDGDILFFYGVIGMIAFLFRKMQPRYLAMGIVLVAIAEFAMGIMIRQDIREKRLDYLEVTKSDENRKERSEEEQKAIDTWREIEKEFMPNDADVTENTRIMKSGYVEIAAKIRHAAFLLQTTYLVYGIWDPLALMLLGMALLKWRFLQNEWTTGQYKKTMWIGYGLGIPLVIFEIAYRVKYYPDLPAYLASLDKAAVEWINLIYPVQRILIMMAHVSLIMLLVRSGALGGILRNLAAVGKMALTNYVLQTVICTLLFYGYGLNYYAELKYHQIFYVAAAICLFECLLSPLWLRHFRFGPLEWLWRSLTYWKLQPLNRKREIE